MANKFSSLIFTEEGKDVMTKALADKGQMSIINAYTFTASLTKDLTYSQISGLNPKQTKPMGTVTTDLTTNTVESRLIIDNRDVTADYNLKGIAITGVYGTDNYVLGIINTNETTLVPAYNGQSAQTINLDVSFAISDTSIVTVNTQYAGMLTVADYIALQKYIDQRDAKKADDTAAVHKTGNETINDIKTFLKTIVGSVSGNSGTSDRVNTLAINADVALSSLSNGVYLSTNASKTTSDKPTGAAETYVFVKESNVERFTDISNGQSYFRVKNGSTYTAWNRFSTAAELSNVDASAVHKTGNETIGGSKTFSSAIIANLQGNADTATKLKTARTISFSGAATGTGTFDGSGNVDIALTESAITRTNTSSSQSLAVGGTVTIIDSITTNTSGEITGVNVKTATMPSVYPPNNDSNLVHKSGAETIGGSKTFTDGLSGALAGNATSATKLANARKINGENFDGTADINVDPVVQVISTNKDVFTLDNGFYYYANIGATNKPSGSSNYFVVEVIQSTNNGFMQLVDSNNNAWWTTKSGGTWSAWKTVANDALVAHLDNAETFTGKKTFSAGISTTNIDVSGTTNLTTLDVTYPISGSLGVKTATFTDFAVVAKNMKQYSGRWLATSSNAILNGPTGTIDFNAYIEVTYTWSDAGIITVSNQGSNTWIGTVSSGVIRKWTLVANNSEVVQKSGDTMTGALTVGGNPLTGGSGTYIGNNGYIELGAATAYIDFHGGNSTNDYTSRMYDSGDGLGNKIVDKSGFKILSTPLLASSTNKYNLDTVALGSLVLTGYSHKAIVSVRTDLLGTSPYTQNGDGTTNVLDSVVITWERGHNEKYGTQTITNLWESMNWQRVMRNGVWQPWTQIITSSNIGSQSVTSAGKLITPRTIGGVLFDGTSNINLPGVNIVGNQSTSGNAATATKWQTARTLSLTGDVTGSATIDGSGNVSIATTGSNLVHKTGDETIGGDKTFTGNVNVSGTIDSRQKIYTRTIGTTNDLQIIYTRVGNVVTGRYKAKFAGTFPLSLNDGYKAPTAYPVNVVAYGVDAWFTVDNKFTTNSAGEGNFMFITSDELPTS
ncbi:beta strand repeat-containing protein [Weissella confusa]|uniref:beta strand repeat-containing protein n=1 Tax=Weissella confusa TaxID=1583 RepID=UPI00280AFA55|nr:pyocin knob domain-containing protein [Weissella confusa]